jgi:hypothetical protein
MLLLTLDAFLFKNIIRLKSSESILVLFSESTFPASENNRPEGVDVAGAAK